MTNQDDQTTQVNISNESLFGNRNSLQLVSPLTNETDILKLRKQYIFDYYDRFSQQYKKYQILYNRYHKIKDITEIVLILIGTIFIVLPNFSTIYTEILYQSDNSTDSSQHTYIISSIVSCGAQFQIIFSVLISKIINGKLIQSVRRKMDLNKEYRDKIFNFYCCAIEDKQISTEEFISFRVLINEFDRNVEKFSSESSEQKIISDPV